MHRERFAKIVATLGPASSDINMIRALFKAGVDMFRLNFSHGDYEVHQENIKKIREVEKEFSYPIAVLLDLQGPKFRVGRFVNEKVALKKGQQFIFDTNEELGDDTRVYLPHKEIFEAAQIGDRLLIDDARTCFEVVANDGNTITTKHIYGKYISNNKGLNMPDTLLDVPVLTEKDERDLAFGLTQSIDYVALSFVQRASDMKYLRKKVGDKANILAKIEKPAAVKDIKAILKASDAIMVARGDLGVEYPPEKLPSIQKTLIRKARKQGKPVIVATQMLESMIESPVATRAEATDVAAAITEGADAVMLSGETAMGKYPVEAVTFMNKVIRETEKDYRYKNKIKNISIKDDSTPEHAISCGVKAVVNTMPITAVACFTTSGGSAIRLSKERVLTPIVAIMPSIHAARKLQLYWGVSADKVTNLNRFETVISAGVEIIKKHGLAKDGEWVVVTAGVPFGKAGTTNTLRIAKVGDTTLSQKLIVND